MGIFDGGDGYFSIGNNNSSDNFQWEVEVVFGSDGLGYTTQSYETWNYDFGNVDVSASIDLDNNTASIVINDQCVETWNWFGDLGSVNFGEVDRI